MKNSQHSIISRHEQGYDIYQKNDGFDYQALLKEVLAGDIATKKMNSGNVDRWVMQVNYAGKDYLIKYDSEQETRLEKKLSNMLAGPYHPRLIYQLDRAKKQGCDITAELYFVMVRVQNRLEKEVYTIYEYINGTPLDHYSDITPYFPALASLVKELHRYRLASNDIHAGNIIVTDEGSLKIIVLSARGNLLVCQANDLLALERLYGIVLQEKSAVYYLIRFKEQLRHFSRRLRRKSY